MNILQALRELHGQEKNIKLIISWTTYELYTSYSTYLTPFRG